MEAFMKKEFGEDCFQREYEKHAKKKKRNHG
jgi:hypothetical protein